VSPSNPDRKRSFNQTRTISGSEIASFSEPKIASSALRQSLRVSLPRISRLEQLAGAASIRELDAKKAIAVLCGSHMRYFVKSTAIDLGRSTDTLGKVCLLALIKHDEDHHFLAHVIASVHMTEYSSRSSAAVYSLCSLSQDSMFACLCAMHVLSFYSICKLQRLLSQWTV